MDVISPLTHIAHIKPLVDAGATEFYAGIRLNGTYLGVRPFKESIFPSQGMLEEAVKEAARYNVSIGLCLNGYYAGKKEKLLKFVYRMIKSGMHIFIIRDIDILCLLTQHFPDNTYVISTLTPCFNSYTVKYFESLGVSRIVLPREFSLNEIKALQENNQKSSFEVLIHNITCENINGLCRFHAMNPEEVIKPRYIAKLFAMLTKQSRSACKVRYTLRSFFKGHEIERKKDCMLTDYLHMRCGACAIPFLMHNNIHGVKIIGRTFSLDKKIKDVSFIVRVIKEAKGKPFISYQTIQKIYFDLYGKKCLAPHECHFPTIQTGVM
jgi:collagenase-like PrtC family protease